MIQSQFEAVCNEFEKTLDNNKFCLLIHLYDYSHAFLHIASKLTGQVIFGLYPNMMRIQFKTFLTPKFLEEIYLSNIQNMKIVNGNVIIIDDVLAIRLIED